MKVDIEILGSKATFFDPSGRNYPIEEVQGRRQDLMSANGSTNCKRPIQMDARRKSQQLTSWIKRALLRLYGPPLVLIVIVLSMFALQYFVFF